MTRRLGIPAVPLALALFAGCAPDRAATGPGNGAETENVLTATLLREDSRPAAGCRVRIRPQWWTRGPDGPGAPVPGFLDTVADDSGRIRIQGLPPGVHVLEARLDSTIATAFAFEVSRSVPLVAAGNRRLQAVSAFTGHLELPPGVSRAWVRVRGLDQGAWTDAQGNFALRSLPATAFLAEAITTESVIVAQAIGVPSPGRTLTDTLRPTLARTWIEDFEGDGAHHRYGPFLAGGGNWFVPTQEGALTPTLPRNSVGPALVRDTGAWKGTSLHVTVGKTLAGHAVLGFEFDHHDTSARSRHDLSRLDSLVFTARGSGRLGVKATGSWEDSGIYFAAQVQLGPAWRRYAIPADSQTSSSGRTWRDVAGRTRGLAFVVPDSGDLWLDDIELVGVPPESLFQPLRRP